MEYMKSPTKQPRRGRKVKNWIDYEVVFNYMCEFGVDNNLIIPKEILEKMDEVTNYFGDVASGRITPLKRKRS